MIYGTHRGTWEVFHWATTKRIFNEICHKKFNFQLMRERWEKKSRGVQTNYSLLLFSNWNRISATQKYIQQFNNKKKLQFHSHSHCSHHVSASYLTFFIKISFISQFLSFECKKKELNFIIFCAPKTTTTSYQTSWKKLQLKKFKSWSHFYGWAVYLRTLHHIHQKERFRVFERAFFTPFYFISISCRSLSLTHSCMHWACNHVKCSRAEPFWKKKLKSARGGRFYLNYWLENLKMGV